MNMTYIIEQATQTRNATSSDTEEDSLDTFSLLNDSWVTDPDADDEAEASDRSKIKPEILEQAISKAEMELKELQESYEKVKSMKETKKKATQQLTLKERLKNSLRPKSRTKDWYMVHKAVQVTADSESQSCGPALKSVGSMRRRKTQHATTSGAIYSSDADISEMEEIKRRESHIQEVIVKVESKIHDMRTILEKLIYTKAQQKRDKLDKELMNLKKQANDKNEEILELTKETLDLKAKIKFEEKTVELKDTLNINKNKVETEEKCSVPLPQSNVHKTKLKEVKSKDKIKTKPDLEDKERPSTTKSLADDLDERRKRSFSKCKRQHSAKGHGKEIQKKSQNYAGSTDS